MTEREREPHVVELGPRLFNRKNAAKYMGVSLRTFDKWRHLYQVTLDGIVRYDRELIDRHIHLCHDPKSFAHRGPS
ncbi:MAG TPA: hypothetical protein VJ825_06510 [Gemmatimonadaceae bacterium]|nr:hypothetical protein [Gemmatimonadaceae bacterium]